MAGAERWPRCGGVCAGGRQDTDRTCLLTVNGLKSAVAIFRRRISINSGSRLLATKIDETTAGASARARDGGIAAAR